MAAIKQMLLVGFTKGGRQSAAALLQLQRWATRLQSDDQAALTVFGSGPHPENVHAEKHFCAMYKVEARFKGKILIKISFFFLFFFLSLLLAAIVVLKWTLLETPVVERPNVQVFQPASILLWWWCLSIRKKYTTAQG